MGRQIIQQPDGHFAIWSSIVNDFILDDADPDELVAFFTAEAQRGVETSVIEKVEALRRGEKPYFQFTMTHAEACAFRDACRADAESETT